MLLNSYTLQRAILMKKKRDEYKNIINITPKNNIFSLNNTLFEKKDFIPEIKKINTKPKKGIPQILDLSDLDGMILPELKKNKLKGPDDDDELKNKIKDEVEKGEDKVKDKNEDEDKDKVKDKNKDEDKNEVEDEDEDEDEVEDEDEDEGVKVDVDDLYEEDDIVKIELNDKKEEKEEKKEKEEKEEKEEKKEGGGDNKNIKKIVVTSFF